MSDEPRVQLVHRSGADVATLFERMADVYQQVYAEPPYLSGPLFSRQRFAERTRRQAETEGFGLVAAESDGELVGFAFGLPFPPGQWWAGEATPPPPEVLAATKFAVIELVLLNPFRGRGLGHAMLDELLAKRPEPWAFLTAHPQAPARRLYERWGWRCIGTAHHAPDSPVFDSLVLPLPGGQSATPPSTHQV